MIWATQYILVNGRWTSRQGWVQNNLAYFDSAITDWTGALHATPGDQIVGGRRWRTTCSAASGVRTCTTWILSTVVTRTIVNGSIQYTSRQQWVFNDVLYLTAP